MLPKDAVNEAFWKTTTGEQVKYFLDSKRTDTSRVRLASRGECVADYSDIPKIKDIADKNPDRLFMLPTRAWRDSLLHAAFKSAVEDLPNLRPLASLDPSNTDEEVEFLKDTGWSTMFYGNNMATKGRAKCPKTWTSSGKVKCQNCPSNNHCFSSKQVHIHLKQH